MATRKSSARKQTPGTEAEIVFPAINGEQAVVTAEPGDVIDGSEDDTTELEREDTATVASDVGGDDPSPAVAAAVRAVKNASAKKTKVEPMTEISKAEMIRNEITKRKNAGEANIRPRDIVAALASKGVKVHAPQVSVALRDFGTSSGKKPATTVKSTKKVEKESKRILARTKTPTSTAAKPSASSPMIEDLTTTGVFVRGIGGVDKAREMLDAYVKIMNPSK